MTKLLGGMDMSGFDSNRHSNFIAIVICTQEYLDALNRRLAKKQLSFELSKHIVRTTIHNELRFNKDDCLVLCCRIDRDEIIDDITSKKKYRQKDEIRKKFHKEFYRIIQTKIEAFLMSHKCDKRDIIFECDDDCENFIKDIDFRYTKNDGVVYKISDIVVWYNKNDNPIDGVYESEPYKKLQKHFKNPVSRST